MNDSNSTPQQNPEDRDRPEGPDKQTGAGRADDGGPQPDIDAEFAAMMEGLSLPDEMQADLESLDETGPSVISVDDVPHNTYTAPREPLAGARGPADREPDHHDDPDGLTPEQAAEADSLAAALNAEAPRTPQAVKVAVVLTPLASAEALASLCAMSDLDCPRAPAPSRSRSSCPPTPSGTSPSCSGERTPSPPRPPSSPRPSPASAARASC